MILIDYLLAVLLLLALPAEALWKTLRPGPAAARQGLSARLLRTLRTVLVLLAILFGLWWWEGRSVAPLGLDMPVSTTGLIGIGAAVAVLAVLAATLLLTRDKGADAELPNNAATIPQTNRETRLFVLLAVVAGAGWELLYRGYLLWLLPPLMGMPAAVILAAVAYGLGHGDSDWRSVAGATVSSFLFTIAYALSGSLWWLMLLHIGLPLVGALAMRQRRSANVNTP